jgi:DNA-binding response OmpR family regulator
LLVTDNDMPRLEGMTLIKRLRDWGLLLPVIMASGSCFTNETGSDAQLQIAAILPKPFATAILLDTVKFVLNV